MGGRGGSGGLLSQSEKDKNNIKARLGAIIDNEGTAGGYHYRIEENNWEKYGKSRTYYSVIETRDNSKHYSKTDYGYYDNNAKKYVPGKSDVMKNYSLGGNKFDIDEALKKKKRKKR